MTMLVNLRSIVMRAVMVMTRGNDLAALDQYSTKRETHLTLRGSLGALRKIELRLIHCVDEERCNASSNSAVSA